LPFTPIIVIVVVVVVVVVVSSLVVVDAHVVVAMGVKRDIDIMIDR